MNDDRANDDFNRFWNNSCNFGVILGKNKKNTINYGFEKVKIEEKMFFFFRLNNLFQISYLSFLWYEFYDFFS